MSFGVPFTEVDTVYFGGSLERTQIRPGASIPQAYIDYAERFGYTSTTLPLSLAWTRDDRDSALAPTRGRMQRLAGEVGVAGDGRYVRGNYQFQQYQPLSKQYTLAFNTEMGWGQGLAGRPFPVFKNFYAGGLGSVRGFQQSTLGPRDTLTNDAIGGAKKFVLNGEILTPFPGAGNDRTLRLYGFVDVGNAWGDNQRVRAADLRASVGLGISWISPVGPLRLAYAKPVRSLDGDKIEKFQFQIGTAF